MFIFLFSVWSQLSVVWVFNDSSAVCNITNWHDSTVLSVNQWQCLNKCCKSPCVDAIRSFCPHHPVSITSTGSLKQSLDLLPHDVQLQKKHFSLRAFFSRRTQTVETKRRAVFPSPSSRMWSVCCDEFFVPEQWIPWMAPRMAQRRSMSTAACEGVLTVCLNTEAAVRPPFGISSPLTKTAPGFTQPPWRCSTFWPWEDRPLSVALALLCSCSAHRALTFFQLKSSIMFNI